ncbi:MAG: ATP-binding protein [Gaiellaceae bacterium]
MSASRGAEIRAQVQRVRALAREIETAVPMTATSVDGRTFSYQAPVGTSLVAPGGYVAIDGGAGRVLGQVITQQLVTREGPEVGLSLDEGLADGGDALGVKARVRLRLVEGDGVILDPDAIPVVDASLAAATPEEVRTYLERSAQGRKGLEIGALALVEGDVPAALLANGFDRHTFLCGQSGSGKTYSLGVVLERLLLETSLRVVILDPNSDFVRLPETRAGADAALAQRFGAIAPEICVRRVHATSGARLRVRFGELDEVARGAILRLDPIADGEEYAELQEVLGLERVAEAMARLGLNETEAAGGREARALVRRIRNLGVERWDVWARGEAGRSIRDELDADDWRVLVVDLGTLGSPQEKEVVAQSVLGRLWDRRNERRPLLVVVDEAHNVCPRLPETPLQWLATDYAIRIAAEGRKFGLYLLVSTQRPQKVHENVVSQCDNLLLMRMNSAADLEYLAQVFSFVPPSLVAQATGFRQGEALVAGKLVGTPTFVRFGTRITEEGGSDVPADWATPA